MNKVYTSSLSTSLFHWLDVFTKKTGLTKKEIIEKALLDYQKKLKKEELSKTFQKAKNDQEIIAMAGEGMDDYLNRIKNI